MLEKNTIHPSILCMVLISDFIDTTRNLKSSALTCSPNTTPDYPHLTSNIQQTKNETTEVVINNIVASS